jgi:hypothetical protein
LLTVCGTLLRAQAAVAQTAEPPDPEAQIVSNAGASVNPLPPSAFLDTVLPTLHDLYASTPAPNQVARTGRAWQIIPVLTVAEASTNDASVLGGTGTDFVTQVTPDVTLLVDSARLQAALHYAPVAEIYAENSGASRFRQAGNGDGVLTLLPDWLFVDARAVAAQVPVFGGPDLSATPALAPYARETVASMAISPYVAHAFGGTGTLQTGVGYLYTAVDAPSYLDLVSLGLHPAPGFGDSGAWLATKRAFAVFTTGEDLQRLQDRIGVDASFYDGIGELRGGRRVLATEDASYALNRFFCLLGQIGYENADYPEGGARYDGAVGAAGVRVTPGPDSTLTVAYRSIDGVNAPYIDAAWQASPHIRVLAGYSAGIESYAQDQQIELSAANLRPDWITPGTLVAALPVAVAGSFAGNEALKRVRRLDISAVRTGMRDTITVSYFWQHAAIVGDAYGPATFWQRSGNAFANSTAAVYWMHELRPDLTARLQGGYTTARNAASIAAASASVLISLGLTKAFSETLTGALTYAGTYFVRDASVDRFDRGASTLTVSMTKRF